MSLLDNLQQDIYKNLGAVESFVEMPLQVVDKSETMSTPDVDKLSNLLIGLKVHLDLVQDYFTDRIEEGIRENRSGGEFSGTLQLDKEYKVFVHKTISDLLSLQPGDLISWKSTPNHEVICRKLGSAPL